MEIEVETDGHQRLDNGNGFWFLFILSHFTPTSLQLHYQEPKSHPSSDSFWTEECIMQDEKSIKNPLQFHREDLQLLLIQSHDIHQNFKRKSCL